MGRGLSDLQKTILLLALENREAPEYKRPPLEAPGWLKCWLFDEERYDIYLAEIHIAVYGFPIDRNADGRWLQARHLNDPRLTDREIAHLRRGDVRFSDVFTRLTCEQQAAKNRAAVVISRACYRLVGRGLLEGDFKFRLTFAGVHAAKSLTAKPVRLHDRFNQYEVSKT